MADENNGNAASPDQPAGRLSVGALLAEARAATGRELSDLARETRVPLRHLMAIEADDHEALPALPYALGFVKTFARAVGLNPEAVGAQFRAETRLTPHVPTAPSLEPMDEARLPSRGLAWAGAAVLLLVFAGLGLYGAGVFDPAPQTPPPAVATASPPPAAAPGPAAPAAATPAAPAAIPTSGEVVLTAREDVWVKIYNRATGKKAFQGLMVAGSNYKVPADGAALTLRAGRAGVIDVTVAGVKLPPLGGPMDTVDGVLLTAPALAARFAPASAPPAPPAVQPRPPAPVQTPVMPAPAQAAPTPATGA